MLYRLVKTLTFFFVLTGCQPTTGHDENVFTLYRSSFVGSARIHLATFDADERLQYNLENCKTTAQLFQRQAGVKVLYWCERGRFSETARP